MSAEETALKREKKDKKKHKSKKEKSDQDAAGTSEPQDNAVADVKEKKSKKRKRETIPEELEIDVSLPEPPSKKALRKAKKSKAEPEADVAKEGSDEDGEESDSKPSKSSHSNNTNKDEEQKERRTVHSIWIGNLPWTATKQDLRDFLCDHGSLQSSQIVRLHMPAPSEKVSQDTRGRPAFKNRGFAYVDFDGPEALFSALQLTETPFFRSGRNVLVKNAKSFEGRPEEHAVAAAAKAKAPAGNLQKPPSKRVFVGNLAFETTKEDLQGHFIQCGKVENIHMATFEDSGKSKGYAWVTLATLEAAEAAVRGYIIKEPEDEDEDGEDVGADTDADEAEAKPKQKKRKGRKWYVNRLYGRELKCEYAEDPSVRYKKRFGGNKRQEDEENNGEAPITEVGNETRERKTGHDRRREQRRAQRNSTFKVDARTIAPGAALANAQRSTGAITEAKGTKVTFD